MIRKRSRLSAVGRKTCSLLAITLTLVGVGRAADTNKDQTSTAAVAAAELPAGHSMHGEAFNEGPRQSAYLMSGTGEIEFKTTSEHPQVQRFVEQGIGQLHGFWYFEAERSFRQAAMLDPNCAIAYWGMALANTNNEERAKGFIAEAVERESHASERERRYIDAANAFLTSVEKKRDREREYVKALEQIASDFPDDLEAKAFLGHALYRYRTSAKKDYSEVDVVLDRVLGKQALHPVHHYRIHLWDHKSPQRALDSAAKCGPSAPAIAHMWHMCGHIFSRVKRYGDAAWFQEASARVDHRHMMHDRVLPDEIHNFAHNNEWLIRNLMHVGRVRDAVDLAKNMIELPRHPKYNMLDRRNSASYGRQRLLDVLTRYEMWNELISLADGPYLEPTNDTSQQLKRLHHLGRALAATGRFDAAKKVIDQLNERLRDVEQLEAKAAAKPVSVKDQDTTGADKNNGTSEGQPGDTKPTSDDEQGKEESEQDKLKKRRGNIERAIACVKGRMAWADENHKAALSHLEKAEENKLALARLRAIVGDDEEAVKLARDYTKSRKRQVQPLAGFIEVLWTAGRHDEAREEFVRLRAQSEWLQVDVPIFRRLGPIASELGFPTEWRVEKPEADDLGDRPQLETLGPFRWSPPPALDWILPDSNGRLHSLSDYRGRPVLVIFYLGYGCLHCAEQLQALAPKVADFGEAGISLIAISTDERIDLAKSREAYDKGDLNFPLVANPELDVFKRYRVYDDFEQQPLHGTFLVDARGRVRWQDISYEPFMDIDFLLTESKRLLAPPVANPAAQNVLARRSGSEREQFDSQK